MWRTAAAYFENRSQWPSRAIQLRQSSNLLSIACNGRPVTVLSHSNHASIKIRKLGMGHDCDLLSEKLDRNLFTEQKLMLNKFNKWELITSKGYNL